jgi:hypothetical protein
MNFFEILRFSYLKKHRKSEPIKDEERMKKRKSEIRDTKPATIKKDKDTGGLAL